MKKIIISLLLIMLVSPAAAETNVRAAIITEITEDVVTAEDAYGLIWEFYITEDLDVGDLVIMEMWDADTPETVFDDEIINVEYSGYTAADIR
jgi:hypothetical protein